MSAWNYADVWETIAECRGDDVALVHGDRRVPWRSFDRRANGVAANLLELGLQRQAHVAQFLANGPEYLESMFACFKAALVPVNTNYRYGPDELTYLWTVADIEVVIFQGRFTPAAAAVRPRVGCVRCWVHVDDGTHRCPDWAQDYEQWAIERERVTGPSGRSPDDLVLQFTGGTTGLPKGVMWRQDDIFARMNAGAMLRYPEHGTLDDVRAVQADRRGPVHMPASPLMHGTAAITTKSCLSQGGTVVTLTATSFDPVELLDAIQRERVQTLAIVGNMFSGPILQTMDDNPGRWDISSLRQVLSSGVAWSLDLQAALLAHNPQLMIIDAFGSSEAIGLGRAVRTSERLGDGAVFEIPSTTRVIDDANQDVVPGSGQVGRVAAWGRVPLGYYGDPAASAITFPTIDGQRYSIPGDLALVNADGTMQLLGRGSQCINTGGEKVFVEEVEEVIRSHPDVADAAVVGLPDPTWGQSICAVVQPVAGATVSGEAIRTHVKAHLAGYKAPRHVVSVASLTRGPNGKLDYPALSELASSALRTTEHA